jgi:hypothetical protein
MPVASHRVNPGTVGVDVVNQYGSMEEKPEAFLRELRSTVVIGAELAIASGYLKSKREGPHCAWFDVTGFRRFACF